MGCSENSFVFGGWVVQKIVLFLVDGLFMKQFCFWWMGCSENSFVFGGWRERF